MSLHLIIDGYNFIRQSPELREYEREDLDKGREMLLRQLSTYQRIKRNAITVVFDGWIEGALTEERDRVGKIQVIFSRRGEKADEVIRRLASQYREKAVVVTSDGDLGYSCRREGCEVITSQEFMTRVEIAHYVDMKGEVEEDNLYGMPQRGSTKKKGPSRRLPKFQRRRHKVLKKL